MCWHYLIACQPWSGSTCVMSSLSSTDRIFDMQMRCESVCSDGWLDCARAIWVGDAVYRTLYHCVRVVQSRWHFSLLSSACLLIRDYLCKVTHVSRQRSSDLRCIMIIVCRNVRHVSDAVILCILVDGHVWINSNLMAVKRDAWFKLIVCDIWVNVVASEDRVFVLSCRRYLGIWTSLVPESCWHFNSFVFSVSCSVLVFLVFDVCWSRMRLRM